MYYLIDDDPERRYDDVDDLLDACISQDFWLDDTDGFDEYLNEGNSIEINGYTFEPSEVLKELNNDAYQSELDYWAESRAENEREDAEYSLARARSGEEVWICQYRVVCYDEEEDDEDEDGYADTDGDDRLLFERLEKKIMEQQAAEALAAEKENAVGNDFLSVIGIQII